MKLNLKSNPDKLTYTVGRLSENDLVIADMAVSRKHGRFIKQQDGTWLYKDESLNGTTVIQQGGNGVYVHNGTVKLTTPCQLLLGTSVLEVTS